MNSHFETRERRSSNLDRAMTPEQFTQVVDAILEGKYSWACVLILRFAGYNPLHYIPYRTYNRLMKENNPDYRRKRTQPNQADPQLMNQPAKSNRSDANFNSCPDDQTTSLNDHQIRDLNYLEPLHEERSQLSRVKGGDRFSWFNFWKM